MQVLHKMVRSRCVICC